MVFKKIFKTDVLDKMAHPSIKNLGVAVGYCKTDRANIMTGDFFFLSGPAMLRKSSS